MLIQCPKCQTTYKASDDVLTGSAPVFRCSRCKHTFELEIKEQPESWAELSKARESGSAAPLADPELSLPFTPTPRASRIDGESEESVDFPAEEKTAAAPDFDRSDRWSLNDDDRQAEHSFNIFDRNQSIIDESVAGKSKDFPASTSSRPGTKERDKIENANNILAISPYLEQRASILPFVTLFALLVICFSLLTIISHAHPNASAEVVKKIPLVGPSMLKNNHLKDGILIQSLRSGHQTIQGNREIFLIMGVVFNQNPVVVREIQLTGKIYNREGRELERQTIWVGNTISPKIIRGMTPEDIPHLQNLKPLKSFEIPSGDSMPFTIVFLKSTKNAKDFTCEVVVAADGEV
jgi:predicted Zn finger-like uncharacterized protein